MPRLFLFSLLLMSLFCTPVHSGVLQSGTLEISFQSNGAIDSAIYKGVNFFKPGAGTDVSNFGLQNGLDTNTFLLNRTNGVGGLVLTESGTTYAGTHSWSSSNSLDYLRTYSLAGPNALLVTTTVTNIGTDSFSVSHFDTFDPDQAFGFVPGAVLASFQTRNSVLTLPSGALIGQARIDLGVSNLTVVIGSLDSRAVVASGGPLQIGSGKDLNKFLASPVNGNDTLSDRGTHIGFRQLLAANESTTFSYIMAFGDDPNDAQAAFTLASVPEPGTIAVFGAVGICGLFFRRRLRR